ncbi:MAG: gluconokinase [Luteolibacter sp.]
MIDAVVVMGVSGCGKSTIAELLAGKLGGAFFDGDDFHPAENKAKMKSGTPLTDEDRVGWLDSLCELIGKEKASVVACSALKKAYRDKLRGAAEKVCFIHLSGSRELLAERLKERAMATDHFMNPALLDSQLETLEDPEGEHDTCVLNIVDPPENLTENAVVFLKSINQ